MCTSHHEVPTINNLTRIGIWLSNLTQFLNLRQFGLSWVCSVYYICKCTEYHQMRILFQRILWSCLIHLLGIDSTEYLSQSLLIIEKSPYFLPNSSLIAIGIAPWLLHYIYRYCYRPVCPSIWGRLQSHSETELFYQLKCQMIQLGGKNFGYRSF